MLKKSQTMVEAWKSKNCKKQNQYSPRQWTPVNYYFLLERQLELGNTYIAQKNSKAMYNYCFTSFLLICVLVGASIKIN